MTHEVDPRLAQWAYERVGLYRPENDGQGAWGDEFDEALDIVRRYGWQPAPDCPVCHGEGMHCTRHDDRNCPPLTVCPETNPAGRCSYYRRCVCVDLT